MLFKTKTLEGFKLDSLDGEMGKVHDFYFDDRHWTIRYLVADTGHWLTGRKVLISPYSLVAAIKDDKRIAVNLTKQQIESSPLLETDRPVSRQFERSYSGYFGWPMYWGGTAVWGNQPTPTLEPGYFSEPVGEQTEKTGDSHLRSIKELEGYHLQATDDEVGHIEDFMVDDETWTIRYLIVDTRNWWPGKKVLVSPEWVGEVYWGQAIVSVNLSREEIEGAPEFTDKSVVDRDYEAKLYRHYGREGYWTRERERQGVT